MSAGDNYANGSTGGEATHKLTENDVKKIWALRYTGFTAQQIKDILKLKVSITAIKAIRRGETWTSVTSKLQ